MSVNCQGGKKSNIITKRVTMALNTSPYVLCQFVVMVEGSQYSWTNSRRETPTNKADGSGGAKTYTLYSVKSTNDGLSFHYYMTAAVSHTFEERGNVSNIYVHLTTHIFCVVFYFHTSLQHKVIYICKYYDLTTRECGF